MQMKNWLILKLFDIELSINEDSLDDENDIHINNNESSDININKENCIDLKYLIYMVDC